MTLTIEVTGEAIADTTNLTSLILDDKNNLGMEYEALTKIIGQLVHALNTVSKQVQKLDDDDEELHDAVQHLEQQISSFEVRTRECEDTCQEIRLQLGTMVEVQERIATPSFEQMSSDVSRKDLNELVVKLDVMKKELNDVRKTQQRDSEAQHSKFEEVEETLTKFQETIDDDIESRLAQNDEDRSQIKSDLEVLRQSLEETKNRKASKVEVGDIAHRVQTLDDGQQANYRMLTDAQKQFEKLDGLTKLVETNQQRIQEMWGLFGKESQELREWASSGFVELRSAVRSKMSEQDASLQFESLKKDVRDLGPFVTETMYRVEADLSQKAPASEVQRLQDDVEQLNKVAGKPKQLLLGTKCLACNREVNSTTMTDQGNVSLQDRRAKAELWDEVQRSLAKQSEPGQGDPDDSVLRFIAINVGHPMKAKSLAGTGMFAGRSMSRHAREQSTSGHYLMRVGGGGGGLSRPQTHSGITGETRSPPREPVPLVRMSPRRAAPATKMGQPILPDGPRPDYATRPKHNMRAALGSTAGVSVLWSGKTDMTPPNAKNVSSVMDAYNEPESPDYSPKMQPAAHSGGRQPEATEHDAYVINRGSSPSPSPPDSRPPSAGY